MKKNQKKYPAKIALIRAGMGENIKKGKSVVALEPLSLAVLSALTPPQVEVEIFDEYVEPAPLQGDWDLVAISAGTYQVKRAYRLALQYRKLNIPVALGGYHPSILPDEAKEYADSVVVGDAESVWELLLIDAAKGKLKKIYNAGPSCMPPGFMPDRSRFKHKYMPVQMVQYGRGCPYYCDFCSVKLMYPKGCSHRSIDDVLAEIESSEQGWVFFVDDNILANRKKTKELLREMIGLKKKWGTQVSIDFTDDEELLQLMMESGCTMIQVGLESLNPASLKEMKKKWSPVEEYQKRIQMIREAGIMLYGSFVFGYDDDSASDVQRALEFAVENKFFLCNFNHLLPYPGTGIYDKLHKQKRLIYEKWWIDPEYNYGDVIFNPAKISAAALGEECQKARVAFHSYKKIASRANDFEANLGNLKNAILFLIANLASRGDVYKKNKMKL